MSDYRVSPGTPTTAALTAFAPGQQNAGSKGFSTGAPVGGPISWQSAIPAPKSSIGLGGGNDQADLPFFFQQTGRPVPLNPHMTSTDAVAGDATGVSSHQYNTFSGSGRASFGDSTSRHGAGSQHTVGPGFPNSGGPFGHSLHSNVSSSDRTPTHNNTNAATTHQQQHQQQQGGYTQQGEFVYQQVHQSAINQHHQPTYQQMAPPQQHHQQQPLFADPMYPSHVQQPQLHHPGVQYISPGGGGVLGAFPNQYLNQHLQFAQQSNSLPGYQTVNQHLQRSPSHYQQQQQQGGQGVGGVCKDHIVGRCIRPNCRFLHLPNSVRPLPEDVCKDYARGSCGRPVCRFFHGSPEELIRLKGLQRSHPELLITSTGEALTAERIQAVIQNPPPMPVIHQNSEDARSADYPATSPSGTDYGAHTETTSEPDVAISHSHQGEGAKQGIPRPVIDTAGSQLSPALSAAQTPTHQHQSALTNEAPTTAMILAQLRQQLLSTQQELHECQARVSHLSGILVTALSTIDRIEANNQSSHQEPQHQHPPKFSDE